ncbi:MAG TPA: site-specific integrase [Verrucomicrobiae bacterium]|nr:site-specific integrase [Verrucomicrobiae bacterium]
MAIFYRDGSWWIDYRINGRRGPRKREKIGPSKQLARTVLQKRKVEIAEGKFLDRRLIDRTTFKEFSEQFLRVHSAVKRSKDRDDYIVARFSERWGPRLLSDVTSQHIEAWRAERSEQVSHGTVNRELECLKTLFGKAVEWGKLTDSPARGIRKFRLNNQRKRYITQGQFESLLAKCSDNLKPIVLVARHTGLRRGEILSLRWTDVDLRNRLIYVRESKNGEAREVPLNASVRSTLRSLPRQIGSERVFAITHVQKSFARACKAAGIEDFTFHDLRHTFASHLVMSGVDLNTVRDLLGHKSLAMTLRYAHLSPAHRTEAVEVLDRYVDTPVDTEAESRDSDVG